MDIIEYGVDVKPKSTGIGDDFEIMDSRWNDLHPKRRLTIKPWDLGNIMLYKEG